MNKTDIFETPSIAVIGPMRSGKSATLLKWIDQYEQAGLSILVIKPESDTRDGAEIVSRDRNLPVNNYPAYTVQNTKQIVAVYERLKAKDEKPDVLIIDEAMLLDDGLVMIRDYATLQGTLVRIAGLETDFRGEFFELSMFGYAEDPRNTTTMEDVLSDYHQVIRQEANCSISGCQIPASKTQKLVNGKPAKWDSETIDIGDSQYEPRCNAHHTIIDRPNKPEKSSKHKSLWPKEKMPEKPDKSAREKRIKNNKKR